MQTLLRENKLSYVQKNKIPILKTSTNPFGKMYLKHRCSLRNLESNNAEKDCRENKTLDTNL